MPFGRLFGERCVRYAESRTRVELEGLPTCDLCRLKITAGREPQRPCPECHAVMDKSVVLNVMIDRSPCCHGAWLDGGELQRLRKAVRDDGGVDFATGMVLGMAIG